MRTSLDPMLQSFAEMSLISGLERLDKRQGWRGVISNINAQNLPIKEQANIKSRQGVAYTVQEGIRVVSREDGSDVPRDGKTIGEVLLRGNITMKGYLKNPKATEEAFSGGWFHTGDLGVIFENGYIQLKDRAKDIIISIYLNKFFF